MKKILFFCISLLIVTVAFGQIGLFPLEYEELADPVVLPDREQIWAKLVKEPQLSWGSTDERYSKSSVPSIKKSTRWHAKAWKGERINVQALLYTPIDLSEVTFAISDLKNGSATIPASNVSLHFVRCVMTDELSKDGKTGCGHRENKEEWESSLAADVLDHVQTIDVKACTTQPIWVNVWVPQSAKAGKYKASLSVLGRNLSEKKLQLEIEVSNRILPDPNEWVFHLDLWQSPYSVARYYQVPLWSEAHFDAMLPIMKKLADAGQKVITTTIMHKPWNGQTEDHFDSMVGKIKKIDGSWSYDYTVFDKWVEFMMNQVGIDKQINCYTLIPWMLSFDYIDQATNRVMYVNAEPGSSEYKEYWGTFLKDFASHLKQKGWFERTTITMDERELIHMQEAINVIRYADPEFKISLAGTYHSEIESELYELCLAYGNNFPEEIKEKREKAGKISTVYTCCVEALPNMFTFSPPAEASWVIWHSVAGNYDGFLRWAYNSWNADPLRDSRFRTWAAGDCYQIYPGARSSIRLERLIEGIQDAEKIRILRSEFIANNQQKELKKLNEAVARFVPEELTKQNAGKMVIEGRTILNSF